MTLTRGASLTDVAFAVCTALHRAGIEAVLTGESAATFYVPTVYQSDDADFILRYGAAAADVRAALGTTGFRRRVAGDFDHPDLQYTVEFPVGPLAIGSDLVTSWETKHRAEELLHVLSPTDVVRDRFLHFYAWPDLSAYSAALRIGRAMRELVDWDAFETWARREAEADRTYDLRALDRFLRELSIRKRR
jgi:hypothetical protein